ncbi:MAG: Na/Pi cotransporter family protein [Lachnospiraceae bacterium]|nr:Na/Pi cotransporter family protein [Lachnospiraceae bacterium]
MDFSEIITLLSGIALFLFGMSLMGDGLKKIAGNRLEVLLYKLTNTIWKGILLGTGVTAVIQSSSATSVMTVGFVNSGMMKFRQAIGIILGAIVGTSITGWIICLSDLSGSGLAELFSITTISGIVAVVGIILRMFSKKPSRVHIGDIMLGFAVLMFGMDAMSGAVEPLKESPAFINLLTVFSHPLLGIVIGTMFACVLQSASAAVGILQALTVTGAIDFAMAFPLIMGIAIGAAVPVLLSALGASTNGKRTAFIYLLVTGVGVVICGGIFYILHIFVEFSFMEMKMSSVSIAFLNTVFRLVNVIMLYPFIGILEKITVRLIKDKEEDKEEQVSVIRLEDRFLPYPSVAISHCREYINAMAKITQDGFQHAVNILQDYREEGFHDVEKVEKLADQYEDSIGTYLVKVTRYELNGGENSEVSKFLHTLADFERISDHAMDIAFLAQKINEQKISFSSEARTELSVIAKAAARMLSITTEAFIRDNLQLAEKAEPLEAVIDDLSDELKQHHVERLKNGMCDIEQGFIFNDLLTNYERVAAHCSNIATAMLELETDEFNTHEYSKNVRKMPHSSFALVFDEFHRQYVVEPFDSDCE